MAEKKRCETCRFNPDVGHCVIDGPLGRPFPVSGICDGWVADEPDAAAQKDGLPADEPKELPLPSSSAFISGMIDDFREKLLAKQYGKVGLVFTLRGGQVTKAEAIDVTTARELGDRGEYDIKTTARENGNGGDE